MKNTYILVVFTLIFQLTLFGQKNSWPNGLPCYFENGFDTLENCSNIICPTATFGEEISIEYCIDGTVKMNGPLFCDLFECCKATSVIPFQWSIDSVMYNLGDGNTLTTLNNGLFEHTYSVISPVNISAMAYFTDVNGNVCISQVLKMVDSVIYEGPCKLIGFVSEKNDPVYTENFLNITPKYISFNPNFIASPCDLKNGLAPVLFNHSLQTNLPSSLSGYNTYIFINGVLTCTLNGLPTTANNNLLCSSDLAPGDYTLEIVYASSPDPLTWDETCYQSEGLQFTVFPCETCNDCNSFKPKVDERYWVSAWVKEEQLTQQYEYTNAHLKIVCVGAGSTFNFLPSGDIIEGWQRIVGDFKIPAGTTNLEIKLMNINPTVNAYFDDIRIHPYNASMKSYVYDPQTLWLTAELDDNNYATFYEYDKEGQLIRIKKETERGIMTIQESRSSNPKKPN